MKKVVCLLLSLSIVFCLTVPIGARVVEEPKLVSTEVVDFATLDVPTPLPSEEAVVSPRAFSRNYTKYLGNTVLYLMEDDNWYDERNVTVSFASASGDTTVMVSIFRTDTNGTIATKYVSLGDSVYFSIPPTGFAIHLYKTSGPNGNATFTVSLS